METTMSIYLRAFPVRIKDMHTGEELENTIVLTKQQLQAAQTIGQSSKELICRAYNAKGYSVLDIGKANKQEVEINLYDLYREAVED